MYLEACNLKWTTQSKNSGESMPLEATNAPRTTTGAVAA